MAFCIVFLNGMLIQQTTYNKDGGTFIKVDVKNTCNIPESLTISQTHKGQMEKKQQWSFRLFFYQQWCKNSLSSKIWYVYRLKVFLKQSHIILE